MTVLLDGIPLRIAACMVVDVCRLVTMDNIRICEYVCNANRVESIVTGG